MRSCIHLFRVPTELQNEVFPPRPSAQCSQNCSSPARPIRSRYTRQLSWLNIFKRKMHVSLKSFLFPGYKVRPEQPYKCDQCDRTYRLKGSLTRHKKAECGAEPSLLCPQCDYRAKIKSNLKLHLMEAHNVEHSQLPTLGLGIYLRILQISFN